MSAVPSPASQSPPSREESAWEKHIWEFLTVGAGILLTSLALIYGPILALITVVAAAVVIVVIRLRLARRVKGETAGQAGVKDRERAVVRQGLQQQLEAIHDLQSFQGGFFQGGLSVEDKGKVEMWRAKTLALLRRAFGEQSPQSVTIAGLELGKIKKPLTALLNLDDEQIERSKYSEDLSVAKAILTAAVEFELSGTELA